MTLSRRELILKYIVEYFIKNAQPVGSQTLIDAYDLKYSSATIRNEMMELESLGFIEKTHTSSGRVPSSKGYRYYIDHLRENDIDESIKHNLAVIFEEKSKSIEDVIKESCQILSHMTNLASVVLGPNADEEHLVSIQFIPLSQNSATAVFVTDKGYVENKTFIIPKNLNITDIEGCMKMLNDRLKGTPISQLVEKTQLLKPIITEYVKNNDAVYQQIAKALLNFTTQRVSMFGSNNLLEQPEFSQDANKLSKLIKLIEAPEQMKDIVEGDNEKFGVHIADEENGKDLEDVSIITSDINVGGKSRGKIALVGPKRMDYDKVLSALEYVLEKIDNLYDEDDTEDDNERKN